MRLYFYSCALKPNKRNTSAQRANEAIRICLTVGLSMFVVGSLVNNALAQHATQIISAEQPAPPSVQSDILTLQTTITRAIEQDDWLVKSHFLESRLQHLSQGAKALPDPTLSIGLLNLPTDGFAIDQEPMTQLKVGASQMFPRGNTLALQEKRLQLTATEQPFLRENRREQVALQATRLWLQAYKASASYQLVETARPLFDKLGDIVSASYASSSGKANQQDIIRAELELVRLNDRLIALESNKQVALSKLSQFLFNTKDYSQNLSTQSFTLPDSLPVLTTKQSKSLQVIPRTPTYLMHTLISGHSLLAANERRILASSVDIQLAEQGYKPQYGVNASYAVRDDAPTVNQGQSRANFFSIGLTMSVPLFSNTRQDANVSSATLKTEAMRTEKLLIMRELVAGLESAFAAYRGASNRLTVYEQQILPQMTQQAQAALNAYTNDTGDFAEVVRAKIDELDAQLTALHIRVEQRLALANMSYFYSPDSDSHTQIAPTQGAPEKGLQAQRVSAANTRGAQSHE